MASPLKMNLKLGRVRTAHDELKDALDGFKARLSKLDESREERPFLFPQAAAEAALILKTMEDMIAEARKAFNEAAIAHRKDGGSFEDGRIAISFQDQERRTPSWQDEAIALAAAAALAAGQPFSKNEYLEAVRAKAKPTAITIVKLTENAG